MTEPLDKLGFQLVGYGCTTCIGNSGPLPDPVANAIKDSDSGRRCRCCRATATSKAACIRRCVPTTSPSPPLVVAYALAGTMDIDLENEPLGKGKDGKAVFLKDIWPSTKELQDTIASSLKAASVPAALRQRLEWPPSSGSARSSPERRHVSRGIRRARTSASPPFFDRFDARQARSRRSDIKGARVLALLGDSVTTDHISPAGNIAKNSPAARYLEEHGVHARDYNQYGARRGNHEVMMRGTFANIRLQNLLAPGTKVA